MKRIASVKIGILAFGFLLSGFTTHASAAVTFTFCSDRVVAPGDSTSGFAGTIYGAAGVLRMTVQQSGPFTLQNLGGSWNNISIGGLQGIPGPNSNLGYNGIVPASAIPGQKIVLTFRIYDILGRLIGQGSTRIIVGGRASGWEQVWQANGSAGVNAYGGLWPGDFDGDGAEEIMAVDTRSGANRWMTMFHYDNNDWQWGWSNYGNPNAGNGIYDYRARFLVGDFDGDNQDEMLGVGPDWITMFHYDNNDWQWGWSNYGNPNVGNGIYDFRHNLLVGNFDDDPADELLGVGPDWITMFHFDNNDWQWGWSNYGDHNAGDGIYPYRYDLKSGDLDGDGKDEVIGLSSWATVFDFDNNDWHWGWSSYGGNSLGGWTYPLASTDRALIGDVDYVDGMAELILIQSGANGSWATTFDFSGNQPNWNWSNYANPPFIGDWPVSSRTASGAAYLLVKAVAGEPAYLIAREAFCASWEMKMYRIEYPNSDY